MNDKDFQQLILSWLSVIYNRLGYLLVVLSLIFGLLFAHLLCN